MNNVMLEESLVHIVRNRSFTFYPRIPPFHPGKKYPEYVFGNVDIINENPIYEMVRNLLFQMGLDGKHFDTPIWNPFKDIIRPGDNVLIKPNMVSNYNWGYRSGLKDTDSLVTHGSVIRAVLDYVIIALAGSGRIVIGDAPLQTAEFDEITKLVGIDAIKEFYRSNGINVELVDFRLKLAKMNDKNQLVFQRGLPGDQLGYRKVNLGKESLLFKESDKFKQFRVPDYDYREMEKHHNNKVNEYLIPNSVLEADVFINLPKLKTHIKAGITVSLKNLVGINGHKDWLPHYRSGPIAIGGDEYREKSFMKRKCIVFKEREWSTKNPFAKQLYRRISRIFGFIAKKYSDDGIYQGGWYGNDTLWRTILDLNRVLLYSDKLGIMQKDIQKKYLSIVDGGIGGEGESPLCPSPKMCGILIGGYNPVSIDVAAATFMGFDYSRIPTVNNAFKINPYELCVFSAEDVIINCDGEMLSLDKMAISNYPISFVPGKGWIGHIELTRPK